MKRRIVGLGAMGISLTAFATFASQAKDEPVEKIEPAQVTMKADEIVAARRATYFLSTQAIGQIKAGINEGGDLRRTVSGARMLANWAGVLPTMFPEGTNLESSRALDTVWSDREGFKERAKAYQEAALELAEIAKTGDRAAANDAFMRMAGTCHACHQNYREE